MPEPGTTTDPVVVQHESDEVVGQEQLGVQVDLDKLGEQKPPESKPVLTPQDNGFALRVMENKYAAARRVNERLEQELAQLKTHVTQVQSKPQTVQMQDELDQLVEQGQWKEAVRRLASQQAEEILKQRESLHQQQTELDTRTKTLEFSKQSVIQKYPELDPNAGDPESAISKVYVQILNDDPRLLSDPYGPEVAMARMERRLSEQHPELSKEAMRRTSKAGQTSLLPSRPNVKSNIVTLSREQKDFCDHNGVKYEEYAKTLRSLEQTGGAEL